MPAVQVLTDSSGKVLLDLIGGEGPFPYDEFIKRPIHIALGLIPLGPRQQIRTGVSVIIENLPIWISGVQGPIDVDFQSFSQFPGKENMSPVRTCRTLQVTAKSMNQFHLETFLFSRFLLTCAML